MSILYILIPLGLVLVAVVFWAVGAGQFDDLETPGWSVLVDEHSGRDNPPEGENEGEGR
jgi:cbb3-type cytochrome oxidase maturation protein